MLPGFAKAPLTDQGSTTISPAWQREARISMKRKGADAHDEDVDEQPLLLFHMYMYMQMHIYNVHMYARMCAHL